MKKNITHKYGIGQVVYVVDRAQSTICETCHQQVPSFEYEVFKAKIEEINIRRTRGKPDISYIISIGNTVDNEETLPYPFSESCIYASEKSAKKSIEDINSVK